MLKILLIFFFSFLFNLKTSFADPTEGEKQAYFIYLINFFNRNFNPIQYKRGTHTFTLHTFSFETAQVLRLQVLEKLASEYGLDINDIVFSELATNDPNKLVIEMDISDSQARGELLQGFEKFKPMLEAWLEKNYLTKEKLTSIEFAELIFLYESNIISETINDPTINAWALIKIKDTVADFLKKSDFAALDNIFLIKYIPSENNLTDNFRNFFNYLIKNKVPPMAGRRFNPRDPVLVMMLYLKKYHELQQNPNDKEVVSKFFFQEIVYNPKYQEGFQAFLHFINSPFNENLYSVDINQYMSLIRTYYQNEYQKLFSVEDKYIFISDFLNVALEKAAFYLGNGNGAAFIKSAMGTTSQQNDSAYLDDLFAKMITAPSLKELLKKFDWYEILNRFFASQDPTIFFYLERLENSFVGEMNL